ncbi:hypothetical protein GCM10022215_29780 [Nocardioides fonticola]|uniref:Gp19/Gp15/Gp42-like protein n=1 Tax=Nocardioides fonticola TaxID=450363 RepID=A0ABP7XPY9_9ACTN
MPNPATTEDLANRWRPLTTQETTVGETLLGDAWVMLTRRLPDLETLMADDADLTLEVTRVLATAVLRVLKNPDGKRQESIDDYSFTLDNSRSAGELYISDDEISSLIPQGNSGAFSADMLADWAARLAAE